MSPAIILFDFDGTLADSFELSIKSLNELATRYGFQPIDLTSAYLLKQYTMIHILNQLKLPWWRLIFLIRDVKKIQGSKIEQIQLFKEIPELIVQLKNEGYSLGILTSNLTVNVRKLLSKYNLEDNFLLIESTSGLFGKDKKLNKIARKLGVNPQQMLYIGDEVRDIQASQKIKLPVVAVSWGFNTRQLLQSYNPDYLVDTVDEILDVIHSFKSPRSM